MENNYPDLHDFSKWPFFKRDELKCKGSGLCKMSPDFMYKLCALRSMYNAPLIITSGYRSPEHNKEVSYTGENGPHTTGRAVDISIRGKEALFIIKAAMSLGFTGFGVSQKGDSRFIHLDDLEYPDFPRPNLWSY